MRCNKKMWWRILILIVIGASGGATVSAGIVALITTIGVVARLAGKSHTAEFAKHYETSITLGALAGTVFSLFPVTVPIGEVGLIITGGFIGIFVGVLAMSLAESLNITSIYARRVQLSKGICYVILGIALGRGIGAFLQLSGFLNIDV